ncbi:MAG: trigger factor, partial [Dehalococcoidia bacterium]|nr:trigger factor [Dehalococcoidia bacterium]
MKVTLERLPESRVQLEIEVEPDRLERSLDAAYKRLVPTLRIPGFRPGKAPRRIVEQMVGRDRLLSEALDALVPAVYTEALESEEVDPVDQPELEILETEPVRFKATVPVRPTVTLGDYESIRIAPEPVEVTDEMFDEQMEMIRRRFATIAPVERGAEWDDILTADIQGTVEGAPFVQAEDVEFPLR